MPAGGMKGQGYLGSILCKAVRGQKCRRAARNIPVTMVTMPVIWLVSLAPQL